MSLWNRRAVVVTGKGGVGRTTTSICVALAAAERGLKTAVVELDGMGAVPEMWGLAGRSYEPRALTANVDTFSLTPQESLDDFGTRRLKSKTLVRMVFHNRIASSFLDAVPGLHDLIQLGKVRDLLQQPAPYDPKYDLLVVDAPATGHGLTLLAAARSMAEMTRVGPFYDEARMIEEWLGDPAWTAVLLVTLPEKLPVNESLELVEQLGPDQRLLRAVVLNQALRNPLPPGLPWPRLRQALAHWDHPSMPALLALADEAADRHRTQARVLARLRDELPALLEHPAPVVPLHYIPGGRPSRDDLHELASELATALDEVPASPEEAA